MGQGSASKDRLIIQAYAFYLFYFIGFFCECRLSEHLVPTGHTRHEQTINIGSDVIISWCIVTANGRDVLDGAHFATLQLHSSKVSFIRCAPES